MIEQNTSSSVPASLIKTTGLCRIYRTETVETTALDDIDLHIAEGELVSIMGPSGAGKSTLLHLLGLLENPTAGQYVLRGEQVARYSERRRIRLRKANIGFVFQNFNLLDELTAFQNAELPLVYQRRPGRERRRRTEEILDRVGLLAQRDQLPHQLSGGQQQRVAIARAVIGRPELILADEPTGNLDTTNGGDIMELLRELNEGGTTVILATHSKADASYGQRIVELFDGRIVSDHLVSEHPVSQHGVPS